MKRAAAIILSLMFVWLQALSSAQPNLLPTPSGGNCCSCKKNCCIRAATPNPQPPAALPANVGPQSDFSLFAPVLVTWTLPATGSSVFSSSASAPLSAPAVPLFTRHCARLI